MLESVREGWKVLCICDPEQRRCTRLQTLFWVSLSRVTPPNPAKNLLRTTPLYWILLATSTAFLAVKLVAPFFLPHQPFPAFPFSPTPKGLE